MRWFGRKSSGAAPAATGTTDVVTDGIALNAGYDEQTIEIIRRVLRPDDVGFDVGAHEGSILEHIVAAAPRGRHHAFEPIPHMAAALRERFTAVTVHEVALSDTDGTVTFNHVVSNPAYSGLKERRYDRPDEEIQVIEIASRRLDALVPADVVPRFVKIDVEGAEKGVLLGGLELLARAQPFIVFEHGLGAADFYGTTPGEVYDILHEGMGLTVTLMASWLGGAAPLSREAFIDDFGTGRNYYFMAHGAG